MMDYVVAFLTNKNWFYAMSQPKNCWTDQVNTCLYNDVYDTLCSYVIYTYQNHISLSVSSILFLLNVFQMYNYVYIFFCSTSMLFFTTFVKNQNFEAWINTDTQQSIIFSVHISTIPMIGIITMRLMVILVPKNTLIMQELY